MHDNSIGNTAYNVESEYYNNNNNQLIYAYQFENIIQISIIEHRMWNSSS